MTIRIDKDVPIPPDNRGAAKKYPWRELEIGDSFLVPGKTTAQFGGLGHATKRTGFKFTARTVEGGVRVWRVK